MKKRIISMLLTVLMLASLVTGLSVSAYADGAGDYIEHTMQQDETVLKVCQDLGINYYDTAVKQAIYKLNGFTSETDFRFLSVGKVVKIPANAEAAASIIKATVDGSSTAATSLTNGNKVAYYLLPYTMSRGETVYNVCNALGINYSQNSAKIMAVNGLSSLDWVKANSTLYFPTATVPAAGVSCIQVQAHTIQPNETAISICNSVGVNYHSNIKLLQALNNNNLDNIKVNGTFYVPVATTITSGTTGSGSATATTGSTTVTTGTAKGTSTVYGVTKYSLAMNVSTGGSAAFYVNGSVATSAAAGEIVTVVPLAADGKALKSIELTYADGSAAPYLYDGASFVMPACSVKATVNFTSGYDVNISSTYSNKVKVLVNGVSSYSASKGDDVQIVSADPSMSVTGQLVIYRNDTGKLWKTLEVSDTDMFQMPGFAVTVGVEMKAVKTYDFYKYFGKTDGTGKEGSFVLQVNGGTVSKAAEGTEVTIMPAPVTGFTVDGMSVKLHGTSTELTVTNGTFVMPGQAVDVRVWFKAGSSSITVKNNSHGSVEAQVGGKKATAATTGTEVTVIVKNVETGYTADEPVVTNNVDGTRVAVTEVTKGSKYTFILPGGGVTVTGQFVGEGCELTAKSLVMGSGNKFNPDTNNINRVIINNYKWDNGTSKKIPTGSLVAVDVDLQAGYEFYGFKVLVDGKEDKQLTTEANEDFSFIMPAGKVTVESYVIAEYMALVGYVETDSCRVEFVDPNDYSKNISGYSAGEKICMLVLPNEGYTITADDIYVYCCDTGEYIHPTQDTDAGRLSKLGVKYSPERGGGVYCFNGPAVGFNVYVTAKVNTYMLTVNSGEGYVPSDVAMVTEGRDYAMDVKRSVVAGEVVSISLVDAKAMDGFVLESAIINYTQNGKPVQRSIEAINGVCDFYMPASDTVVSLKVGKAEYSVYEVTVDAENTAVYLMTSDDLNVPASSYEVGKKVNAMIAPFDGYVIDELKLTNTLTGADLTSQLKPNGSLKDYYYFNMPAGGATLKVKASMHNVVIETAAASTGKIRVLTATSDKTLKTGDAATGYANTVCTVIPSDALLEANTMISSVKYSYTQGGASVTKVATPDDNGYIYFDLPDADLIGGQRTVTLDAATEVIPSDYAVLYANVNIPGVTVTFLADSNDPETVIPAGSYWAVGETVYAAVTWDGTVDASSISDSVVNYSSKNEIGATRQKNSGYNLWTIKVCDGGVLVNVSGKALTLNVKYSGSNVNAVTFNGSASPAKLEKGALVKAQIAYKDGYTDGTVECQYMIGSGTYTQTVTQISEGVWSFTVPEGADNGKDVTLVINPEPRQHTLSTADAVMDGTKGTLKFMDGSSEVDSLTVKTGDKVSMKITPADGLKVASVKVNGSSASLSGGLYSFTMGGSAEIVIEFAEKDKEYTLKASEAVIKPASTAGSIKFVSGYMDVDEITVKAGDPVKFKVNAATGYVVKSVKVNGETKTVSGGTYSFTATGTDVIEVELEEKKEVEITFKAPSGVTVTVKKGSSTVKLTSNKATFSAGDELSVSLTSYGYSNYNASSSKSDVTVSGSNTRNFTVKVSGTLTSSSATVEFTEYGGGFHW